MLRLPILIVLMATSIAAQTIDFETVAGMPPVDGMSISNQYLASDGVTFSLLGGTSPVLAQVGPPQTAFQGHMLLEDTPAPGVPTGQFFLTDDGTLAGIPLPLVITYAAPVSAASGLILDIDFTEEWTVEARDTTGAVVASVVLGANNTVDGSGTSWAFDQGAGSIAEIRITFTGVATGGAVGLAFDNFSTSTVQSSVGQPNSALARLEVNGVGLGTGNGPFAVQIGPTDDLVLDWTGPAGGALVLLGGSLAPQAAVVPCFGSFDLGLPLVLLLDGTTFPGNLIYVLDAAGEAVQTYSLPVLPPGVLIAMQGAVFQPTGLPCAAVFTAAFELFVP